MKTNTTQGPAPWNYSALPPVDPAVARKRGLIVRTDQLGHLHVHPKDLRKVNGPPLLWLPGLYHEGYNFHHRGLMVELAEAGYYSIGLAFTVGKVVHPVAAHAPPAADALASG